MATPNSTWRARTAMVAALITGLAGITAWAGAGTASAKGGTAKPPAGNPAPLVPPTWPAVPPPVFTGNPVTTHGFDATGFIQSATTDPSLCPAIANDPDPAVAARVGGSMVINGITVTVPCNSVVQMPANTLLWSEAIDLASHNPLALDGSGAGAPAAGQPYPSFEASVTGNIVGNRHIAGLVYLSQQSLNSGSGVITRIDYGTGDLWVGSATGQPDQVRLQINDPNGRFGRAQSPDDRFSVDDENPTIHSGTGYPMCVPRTDPGANDDPLCPQRNRPTSTAGTPCRNWTIAGVTLPNAGELPSTPVGERCRAFVMKDPSGALAATDPDARQQAPFEVGDFITYAGTLFKGGAGQPDYISAHTVEGNVGIYTQPGTLPSYLAIGEFGVGSADPNAAAVTGVAQETQDRIFLEAETTDVKAPVDIYLDDVDLATGTEVNRWVTPFEMTGENNGPVVQAGANANLTIGGGITTQNLGAQAQRARLRATKAPTGVLTSPTRTLRVVSRTQCVQPRYILNSLSATSVVPATAVKDAPNVVLPNAARVPAIDTTATAGGLRSATKCLESTKVANGLFAGQYSAPVFEFIFPENVSTGDPVVPYDFWHLGFLVNGEGPGTGPLSPAPW